MRASSLVVVCIGINGLRQRPPEQKNELPVGSRSIQPSTFQFWFVVVIVVSCISVGIEKKLPFLVPIGMFLKKEEEEEKKSHLDGTFLIGIIIVVFVVSLV